MANRGLGDRRQAVGFLRILLAISFAAVLAVVTVTTGPLMWFLGVPLVALILGLAVPYHRAVRENGEASSRTAWLGLVLAAPSVIAIMTRGTDVAYVVGPLLSIAGGLLAWAVLKWTEVPTALDRPKEQGGASAYG